MRNFIPLLLFALLPSVAAAEKSGEPVVIGQQFEIRSEILNEARHLLIAKPPGYDESQDDRYPVLYLLDGNRYFLHTAGLIDFLAKNDRIPPLLVIAVLNTDRSRDLTPPSQVQEEIDALPT